MHQESDGLLFKEYFSLVNHILDSNSGQPEILFQRCRSLSWIFVGVTSSKDLATRTFISASFPVLEYMTIQNMAVGDWHPNIGAPRLPRLKEVTLIDHTEECIPPFFRDEDFANVEKLTFIATSLWMDFDVTCISRFRSIRILMLKADGFYSDYLDTETLGDSLKPAEISLLETLSLYGYVSPQILNMIRAPGLRKMEIEADDTTGWNSLVASNLVHLVGSLERLCVSFSEGMHEASWVEELERLIAEAPPLVNVLVSPWMMQCVIGKAWSSRLYVTDPK